MHDARGGILGCRGLGDVRSRRRLVEFFRLAFGTECQGSSEIGRWIFPGINSRSTWLSSRGRLPISGARLILPQKLRAIWAMPRRDYSFAVECGRLSAGMFMRFARTSAARRKPLVGQSASARSSTRYFISLLSLSFAFAAMIRSRIA